MVKLRGPLGSAEASGSLGRSTVYSSWKGRAYAKTKTIPTNPNSPMQISVRAMMSFLAQRWAEITDPDKATWEALAATTGIPPYNAFLSTNLERWGQFKAPGQIYPIAEDGTQPAATFVSTMATGRTIKATLSLPTKNDVWGAILFRQQTSPVTPTRENTIAIIPIQPGFFTIHNDQNLDPGTYYYQARFFTTHGATGPNETQRSATVT